MNLHSLFLKHSLYSYCHLANVYLCLDMKILLSSNVANTPDTLSQLCSLFFSFLFPSNFFIPFCINFNCLPQFTIFRACICVAVHLCLTTQQHLNDYFRFLNCAVKLNIPYRNSFRFISIHRHYVRFLQHL